MKKKLVFLFVFCSVFLSFPMPSLAQSDTILRSSIIFSKGNIKDSRGFQYEGSDIKMLSEKMNLLYKSCQ